MQSRNQILIRCLALLVLGLLGGPASVRAAEAEPVQAEQPAGLFVVIMERSAAEDDSTGMDALAGHIAHLRKLYDAGSLLLAGPFADDSGRGISVVRAASLEEARGFFEADPSVEAGQMSIIEAHPWWDAFNAFEGRSFSPEELVVVTEEGGAAGEDGSSPREGGTS